MCRLIMRSEPVRVLRYAFLISLLVLVSAGAQTVQITPSQLSLVPLGGLGDDRYWQQLVVTLAADDSASDEAITITMPPGLGIADMDGDGVFADEVRVVYEASGNESPGFFAALSTSPDRIVIGSDQAAAAGGKVYVQFPCVMAEAVGGHIADFRKFDYESNEYASSYGPIYFADDAEIDLVEGPEVGFVSVADFSTLGSMKLVRFSPFLAANSDTLAEAVGHFFPSENRVLIEELPDLVFDGGRVSTSNMLGGGDGDDSNDVDYRFFFSAVSGLSKVDETNGIEAHISTGDVYVEREGMPRSVRLDISELPAGLYYLYVIASPTGSVPLAQSRGIIVRHTPEITSVGPEMDRNVDSGSLYDADGIPNGNGSGQVSIDYAVSDVDDAPVVALFYSEAAERSVVDVATDAAGSIELTGATALTPTGLTEQVGTFTWDVQVETVVPSGSYYIWAVAYDGKSSALARSAGQVHVRHSPFLRLDPLNDRAHVSVDTVHTGGLYPQRYVTFTWGRSGIDGDRDLDSDATIELYYSLEPAGDEGLAIPGGTDAMRMALDEGRSYLIHGNLSEDADRRVDNQYVWDLWSLAQRGDPVPAEGLIHYVYGLISDGENGRLTQMNGGYMNDAGSQLILAHPPSIFPQQPATDISIASGQTCRVSWQDVDLDDDARIRVVLSDLDLGTHPLYDELSGGASYVINSADGRATNAVDSVFDLSEDSTVDHLDVGIDHLMRGLSTDGPLVEGEYALYLAITDEDTFTGAQCWKVPSIVRVEAPVEEEPTSRPVVLLPEQFSMANGGQSQVFEVRIDADAGVDLVQVSFGLDAEAFEVIDQDSVKEGIQPFVIGSGFSKAKMVNNRLAGGDGTPQILTLEYFEPRMEAIEGLGKEAILATFAVRSLFVEAPTTIELVVEDGVGSLSRLERDGVPVVELAGGPLARGELVPGRGIIRGNLVLEGRSDMTAQATCTLRARGDYRPYENALFVDANDLDLSEPGVQIAVAADGSFELSEVPVGLWDLHVGVDGYVEAVAADLSVYAGNIIEDVTPSSAPGGQRARLWGGDVVGYVDEMGTNVADNEVTLADWDYVAAYFGTEVVADNGSEQADITGDGRVDIADLSLVGANFLQSGTQPVYKVGADRQSALIAYEASEQRVYAGQDIRWAIRSSGAESARAYALQLHYDKREWEWVGIQPYEPTAPALYALSDQPYGALWGRAMIGRNGTLVDAEGGLANWVLRALVSDPTSPLIRVDGLIDYADRPVPTVVQGTDRGEGLPQALRLEQNAPNPFNPETQISFTLPQGGAVSLEVYDILGQRVHSIWDGVLQTGHYTMGWNGRDGQGRTAASGVYIYRLETSGQFMAKRMVLVR